MSTVFEFDFENETKPFIYNIDFDLILQLTPLYITTAKMYVTYKPIPHEEIVNSCNDVKIINVDNNELLADSVGYVTCLTEYDVEYKNKTILQIRKNGPRKCKITPV